MLLAMKKIVGRDLLLYYPNFSKSLIIHTDTRKMQLGGVISENGKPIAFDSRKIYSCTKKLYDYIKKTVKYSGKPKRILYNYFRTPYNCIY